MILIFFGTLLTLNMISILRRVEKLLSAVTDVHGMIKYKCNKVSTS